MPRLEDLDYQFTLCYPMSKALKAVSISLPFPFFQSFHMATSLIELPEIERLSPLVIRILAGNPGKVYILPLQLI